MSLPWRYTADQENILNTPQFAPFVDAFGRIRVSNPVTLFDWQSQYNDGPLFWQSKTSGSGSAAHRADEAAMRLSTTTASGDLYIRQTKEYFRYQPGKSQQIFLTFNFLAGDANCEKMIGYGDGENGIFLKENNGSLSLVLRSNVSGTPVDTEIAETAWNNYDYAKGNGFEVDPTKVQIFWIDLEWLGVGSVRCGFVAPDRTMYVVHEFQHANSNTAVYMTTANLPIRASIENTGTTSGAVNFDVICCQVSSEGGFEAGRGAPFSASNGTTLINLTTRVPVLSIKPKDTFNSITNRVGCILQVARGFTQDVEAYMEVVYGGTLTSPVWTSVDSNSAFNYDVSASAISGGTVIGAEYIPSGRGSGAGGARAQSILGRLPMALDIDGSAGSGEVLSIVMTSLAGATDCGGVISWTEIK